MKVKLKIPFKNRKQKFKINAYRHESQESANAQELPPTLQTGIFQIGSATRTYRGTNELSPLRREPATPFYQLSGFNKFLRDIVRCLLAIFSSMMFYGRPEIALCCSIACGVLLRFGKLESIKNLQWGLLAFLTLPLSIWAVFLKSRIEAIDQDRAYQFYLLVSFTERSTEIFSGSMCAFFLVMTIVGKALQ